MDTSKKIIKGAVNGRGFTITSAITQWDYGYVFVPEFEDMPATYRLDFSNDEHHGTALPVYCGSEGGEVPKELIDTGKDIFVWFFYIGDGFGKSEYKWRIPNKCKPKTEQDEPTPSQQSSIDQLIVRSNEAVESAEQSASDADASARMALGYAESAQESARQAQEYSTVAISNANSASQSASQASASATASAQSASQSAQIKADVQALVATAEQAVQDASHKADLADASARSASASAQTASASAQSASGYASQAQTSANTASAKAQDASGYAQTASQKATESAQSASQALSYKTDAESAKTASQTAQTASESARDTAVSAKTDAESARDDAVQAKEDAESAVASISGALAEKAPVITDTASGSIASFSDGADNLPLKSLVVDINPIQDLHGQDAPYPAGGGKNKWVPFSNSTKNGVTLEYDNGVITLNGTASASHNFVVRQVVKSGTYTLSCRYSGVLPQNTTFRAQVFDVDTSSSLTGIACNADQNAYNSFTVSEDAEVEFRIRIDNGHAYSNVKLYPQLELGSTATAFAPYENLCPISGWTGVQTNQSGANLFDGNSFVSGKYDNADFSISSASDIRSAKIYLKAGSYTLSVNGTSSINRRILNGSMSSAIRNLPMSFTLSTDGWFGFSTTDLTNSFKLELGSTATPYEPYTGRSITIDLGQTVYGGKLDVLSGELTVYPYYASYNGETLTGEWISDRDVYAVGTTPTIGAQVVNIGAQGTEYQLEPHEVASLLGINNIFADTGDTACEYRADTKLYIEKLTQPEEDDMIADANITSGQYFMVGNSLYKATANIANGGQITVGTNCTRLSLAQALNEINA